jgi:uncharacterized membrane protein
MWYGVKSDHSPPGRAAGALRLHRLIRLIAVGAAIGALGYGSYQGLAFVEQLLRLAAGALR